MTPPLASRTDGHPVISALEDIEQRYAALFGLNPDAVFAFDTDGRVVSGNGALELMTGYSLRELLGNSFLSMLAEDERDRAWRHFKRALQGEAQSYEVSGVGPDGREFTLAMTNVPMVVNGVVEGVYGTARDITRQKDAERSLRDADERYRLLAENVHDMISLHDHTGTFIYASPSAYRLLGMHPVELIGRSVYDLIEPDDVGILRTAHRTILQREGREPVAYRAPRMDGTTGWFETTARVIMRDGTDEPWRIAAVTRDITERRTLEQHIMQSQKLDALGRLAGGVAHDFNNVLTVITGHAELLTGSLPEGAPERDHAEFIREAALRASALTRRLLAYGRAESRDVRVIDLNSIVLDMQPMLARLLGESTELLLRLEPDLAGVRCEPAALEQVVMNLCVNSRDAMPDGGQLTVRTENFVIPPEALHAIRPGPCVRLTVADSGVGIAPDVLPHIYEPFYTTKPAGTGTGLGLSMVDSIVRQTGGSITVDSAPGHGAVFTITLPAEDGPAQTLRDGRVTPSAALRGSETVMVAEDDAGVRSLIVAALQRYGYRVMAAVDGMQALDLFRTYGHLIDIVVTDVNMPELKGPELVRILAEAGTTIPVLYISGFTQDSLSLDDLAPRRAFLAKPFTPVELAQSVRMLLVARH